MSGEKKSELEVEFERRYGKYFDHTMYSRENVFRQGVQFLAARMVEKAREEAWPAEDVADLEAIIKEITG